MLQLSQNFYFYAILPSPFSVCNFRIPKTNELIYLNTPTEKTPICIFGNLITTNSHRKAYKIFKIRTSDFKRITKTTEQYT